MRKINENSELTEFCGNEVSEILVLSEYSAGQLAAVVVPRGVYVVGAVGVAPRFEKASVLVRYEHLIADQVVAHALEAHGHLVAAKRVERADHVDVVVQVDAAELHEHEEAPIVGS